MTKRCSHLPHLSPLVNHPETKTKKKVKKRERKLSIFDKVRRLLIPKTQTPLSSEKNRLPSWSDYGGSPAVHTPFFPCCPTPAHTFTHTQSCIHIYHTHSHTTQTHTHAHTYYMPYTCSHKHMPYTHTHSHTHKHTTEYIHISHIIHTYAHTSHTLTHTTSSQPFCAPLLNMRFRDC